MINPAGNVNSIAPPRPQAPVQAPVQAPKMPNNNARANGMEFGISDKMNKMSDMFSTSSYTLRVGIIMLLIIIVLIVVYLFVAYYSYQVKVQSLISNGRIVDLTKMMTAEQYVIVNNSDNNFSLGFWLFTNGIKNIDSTPLTLLRCTSGYAPQISVEYNTNLNLDIYKQHKNNVIDKAIFGQYNEKLYDTEKIVVGLYGNDLFIMLKPLTQERDKDKYIYMTIDFLPLSSWNHVSLTVDGEFIVLYLNGEIYKTQSIRTLEAYATTTITKTASTSITKLNVDFNQIVLMPNISRERTDPSDMENSYITKLFFSDDLVSQKQVEQLYASSPYSSSLMSKIGYGLRSPIYRIDEEESGAL